MSEATGVETTHHATSVADRSAIIKKTEVPAVVADELDEGVRWEAEQYIPFDINDVRLGYTPLTARGQAGDRIEFCWSPSSKRVADRSGSHGSSPRQGFVIART